MKHINDCHKDFLSYMSLYSNLKESQLTESDTRSKIIDKIFIDILDWSEESISREGYIVEGYYDYLFSIPGFQFIVEAKKNLINFTIPINHKTVTIGTFEKSNKEVVSQIRRYLYEIGLQYAVITNGHQFIIGKFSNTDGTDWRHNKCLIFNGLDDVNDRFIEFYNILSKNSISENSGFKIFLEESILREGKTILSILPAKDSELVRNPLSSELTPLINDLFGELYNIDNTVNKDLIEECFIENKEIRKNRSEIERLFSDAPPSIERVVKARNTESIVTQISNEISNDKFKFNMSPPNPIVIIGSKGAGKTTFINYLFNGKENTDKSHPHIYIDFRKYTGSKLNFEDKIYSDILEQIYDIHSQIDLSSEKALRSIYHKEIKRNNEGLWKYELEKSEANYNKSITAFLTEKIRNNENHFLKISEHLITSRRIRLCIVIDNADQFDFETQKNVFLFAQSINKRGNVIILISLREGYYYKWRNLPPFDAFACNVYHITAPPYEEVLQKRINYALDQMELDGKSKGSIGNNRILIIQNDSVRKFLLSLKSSLFGDENSEILSLIQETTYPNIRDGLELFKQFLISGHTEVHEYILRQKTNPTGTKVIPFWEFIKAVGLYNKKYYNHNISVVKNIFYPAEGNKNHFLKIKILKFLDNKLTTEGYSDKYINTEELIAVFVNVGYVNKYIKKELIELCKYRLIETDEQISDVEDFNDINFGDSVCISLKGHYYINKLVCNFSYIEMALEDTPIYNEEFFNDIKNTFPLSDDSGKRSLKGRVAVVEKFIDYLDSEEKMDTIESQTFAKNIVSNIRYGTYNDICRIKRIIESNNN